MSLSSIQPSFASQTAARPPRAGGSDHYVASADSARQKDTVNLSMHGLQMSRLSALGPTTPEHLRNLSTTLAVDLNSLLRQAAIDTSTGIGIEIDADSGHIRVQGEGPAAKNVAAVISSQPNLVSRIRDVATLSNHLAATEQGDAVNRAQQHTRQIEQMNAVAAGYAGRFEAWAPTPTSDLTPIQRAGHPAGSERVASAYGSTGGGANGGPNVALRINGASINFFVNGKEWLSSAA